MSSFLEHNTCSRERIVERRTYNARTGQTCGSLSSYQSSRHQFHGSFVVAFSKYRYTELLQTSVADPDIIFGGGGGGGGMK